MATVRLTCTPTVKPDMGRFLFYVEAGRPFDAGDYAEAYGLKPADLDPQDVRTVQDAAARLQPGVWLQVEHTTGDAAPYCVVHLTNPFTGQPVTRDISGLTQDDLDAFVPLMDDDVRNALHDQMAPCTPADFLAAYVERVGPDAAGRIILGS